MKVWWVCWKTGRNFIPHWHVASGETHTRCGIRIPDHALTNRMQATPDAAECCQVCSEQLIPKTKLSLVA